jgi:hypothetical protein
MPNGIWGKCNLHLPFKIENIPKIHEEYAYADAPFGVVDTMHFS